jgi:translation initiation factor 2 subunit 2
MSEFDPTAEGQEVPDEVAAMFDLTQKKKKKKKKATTDATQEGVEVLKEGEEASEKPAASDLDPPSYTYSQLLNRVVDFLHQNNPELTEKRRYTMKPPQLMRGTDNRFLLFWEIYPQNIINTNKLLPVFGSLVGTKKTLWVNFQEICKMMRRNPEHVFQFMMAELGTEGSIDGNQRLVIRGKFVPKVRREASKVPVVVLARSLKQLK